MEHYNLHPDGTIPSFSNLNEINTKSVLEAARDYQGRGFLVTPLRGKRPVLGRWQQRILSGSELPRYFRDGSNIGIVLGGPDGVVDVDLDNSLAVAAAHRLLPDTVRSGRKRHPRSHYWYICDPVPAPRRFSLPESMAGRLMVEPGNETLLELRSTGQQTMVPPSIHPVYGDRYLWYPHDICEIDGEVLANFVLDVAVAALLAISRPLGSREWFAVRAACYLGPRLGPERAERIVAAASAAFDDEEHDGRMRAMRSALWEPVGHDPAINAALAAGLERLAPGVPALIERWCARDRHEGGGAQ